MKKTGFKFIVFAFVALTLYIAQGLLGKIKPFKIQNILAKGHSVREVYEDYLEKFDDNKKVFLLIESQGTPFSEEEIHNASGKIYQILEHTQYIKKITSISEAKYITYDRGYLRLVPFLEKGKLAPRAKENLKTKMWQNTLLDESYKAILLSFEVSPDLPFSSEISHLDKLFAQVEKVRKDWGAVKIHYFGSKVAHYHFTYQMWQNQQVITPLLLVLVGLFIFILFRSFWVVFWSYLVLILAYALVIILIILLEDGVGSYSVFALSFVFVVATSDLIHFFTQFFITQGATPHLRAIKARDGVIIPCALTTLTTSFGFASLMLNDAIPIKYFGFYCSAGTTICFLLTFYFLPFALGVFEFNKVKKQGRDLSLSSRFVPMIFNHSRKIFLSFVIILIFLIYGTTQLKMDDNFYNKFVSNHPFSQSVAAFKKHFNLAGSIDILVSVKGGKSIRSSESTLALQSLISEIEQIEWVSYTKSLLPMLDHVDSELEKYSGEKDLEARRKTSYSIMNLFHNFGATSDFYTLSVDEQRVIIFLNTMRSENLKKTIDQIERIKASQKYSGLDIRTTGFSVVRNFINLMTIQRFLESFGLTLIFIFILFLMIFKSLKVSLVAMVPNLVPLVVISGFMGLANVTIESNFVIMICITIGLSVDDTIHFLYRLKNYIGRENFKVGVQKALEQSGPALMSTTAIFIFSFPCFFLSDLTLFYKVGFFLSLSMIVALICDFILLPLLLVKFNIKSIQGN